MRTSRAGLDIIKAFEGFRPDYQQLPDGRWIIGYGHVRSQREDVTVSEAEADLILRNHDLAPVEQLVTDCILAPLSQNEFDALVSLAFNIGAKAFVGSDIVAQINGGNRLSAAAAFDGWRHARIGKRVQIVDALVRRRASEKALFLTSPGAAPVASSRIYLPLHDEAALPPPPPRNEILIERAPPALTKQPAAATPAPTTSQTRRTATEEAAESVKRRLVRIIGEDNASPLPDLQTTDGASPEEITAAISALAGDNERGPIARSVWPQQDDLPPPPGHDVPHVRQTERQTGREQVGDLVLPSAVECIDDLEKVSVSDADIARALRLNREIDGGGRTDAGLGAATFALLALFGAVLGGFGLGRQLGLFGSDTGAGAELSAYLPPLLMLLGAMIFCVMSYYCVRALATRRA